MSSKSFTTTTGTIKTEVHKKKGFPAHEKKDKERIEQLEAQVETLRNALMDARLSGQAAVRSCVGNDARSPQVDSSPAPLLESTTVMSATSYTAGRRTIYARRADTCPALSEKAHTAIENAVEKKFSEMIIGTELGNSKSELSNEVLHDDYTVFMSENRSAEQLDHSNLSKGLQSDIIVRDLLTNDGHCSRLSDLLDHKERPLSKESNMSAADSLIELIAELDLTYQDNLCKPDCTHSHVHQGSLNVHSDLEVSLSCDGMAAEMTDSNDGAIANLLYGDEYVVKDNKLDDILMPESKSAETGKSADPCIEVGDTLPSIVNKTVCTPAEAIRKPLEKCRSISGSKSPPLCTEPVRSQSLNNFQSSAPQIIADFKLYTNEDRHIMTKQLKAKKLGIRQSFLTQSHPPPVSVSIEEDSASNRTGQSMGTFAFKGQNSDFSNTYLASTCMNIKTNIHSTIPAKAFGSIAKKPVPRPIDAKLECVSIEDNGKTLEITKVCKTTTPYDRNDKNASSFKLLSKPKKLFAISALDNTPLVPSIVKAVNKPSVQQIRDLVPNPKGNVPPPVPDKDAIWKLNLNRP